MKGRSFLLPAAVFFFLIFYLRQENSQPKNQDFLNKYEEYKDLSSQNLHPSDDLLKTSYGLDPEDKIEIVHAINQLKKRIVNENGQNAGLFVKTPVSLMDWDNNLARQAYKLGEDCPSKPKSDLSKGFTITKTYETSPSLSEMVNEWFGEFRKFDKSGVIVDKGESIDGDERHPEGLGCAKVRCFMERVSESFIVCKWRFSDSS